jgi:hypothetical protein
VSIQPLSPAGQAGQVEQAGLAEAMPYRLISLLERRYLSDFQAGVWDLRLPPDDAARPLLREILSLPRPAPGEDPAAAMPHVLSASHTLGQAVVTGVYGDGTRHRFFVGGRRIPRGQVGSTEDFLDGQAGVLRAQLPGIELGPLSRLDGNGLPELAGFMHGAPALAAVTGIPSARADAGSAVFQNVDRLVAAAGSARYVLLVVAEPLDPADLDDTLDRCRRLKSEVHALVRRTVSEGESEGTTRSTARREEGKAHSRTPNLLTGFAVFASVAGLAVPGMSVVASPAMISANAIRMRSLAQQADTVTEGEANTLTRSATSELLNANAEACELLLQRHIARLEAARSSGWWRTAVYVAAESDGALAAVTGALRAIGSGEQTGLDPVRTIRIAPWALRPALTRGQTIGLLPAAQAVSHPLGPSFDAVATCVTTDELAVLVSLPRRDVPGLLMRSVGEFALAVPPAGPDAIRIGALGDSQGRQLDAVALGAAELNRHVFITGMTGYGKTTTAKALLTGARSVLGIPFLVIEPVKAEYRSLRQHPALRGDLRVYSIGGEGALPLRVNPFVPVANVSLARHIDLLKAVFNAAFPMFAGMPYVLEEAMLEVYTERGWNLRTSANDALGPHPSPADLSVLVPSLADLHDKIEVVLSRKRYAMEVHQNMGAALRSRLSSLMVGAKGEALNTSRSVPPAELFTVPCVIELRNLGDNEEKSFVMALLLGLLYEFAESRQADVGPGGPGLQHLTLVEEAHRLLRAPRGPGGPETPDSQANAVTMFTDMLAEMRAYGEGFLVVDQIPAKLAPDILKNSNIKIIHRLVAPDDRAAVAQSMNLTEAQARHLVTLRPGTAVVHDDHIGSAVLVQMTPATVATVASAAPPAAELLARPPDRSYLQRHGGCLHCPAPCTFLEPARRLRASPEADESLQALFRALLFGDAEGASRQWAAWLAGWQAAAPGALPGTAYCAVTQAAYRWLGQVIAARGPADGSAGGIAADGQPAPGQRLAHDRAARLVARLVSAWLEAEGQPDRPAPEALHAALAGLRSLIAERPPHEMAGCASCPARCQMLPLVRPYLAGGRADQRASASSPADSRLRRLQDLVAQAGGFPSGLDERQQRHFMHCLVTNASASSGADPAGLLQALGGTAAEPAVPGAPPAAS